MTVTIKIESYLGQSEATMTTDHMSELTNEEEVVTVEEWLIKMLWATVLEKREDSQGS